MFSGQPFYCRIVGNEMSDLCLRLLYLLRFAD